MDLQAYTQDIKGYIARQKMAPQIAHINVDWLQTGIVWMQSYTSTQVFLVPISISVERQKLAV